jgi:hypothetical protein
MSTRISESGSTKPAYLTEPSPARGRGQGEGARSFLPSPSPLAGEGKRNGDSFLLPSRERPFDKRSGGPAKREGEVARSEISTIAPQRGSDGAHAVLLGPSPLAGEVREGGGAERSKTHAEHPR